MKLPNDCLEIRKELCVMRAPSVDPTITPPRTLQRRGSPSHPSRFRPLNKGRKPSSANAAIAENNSSAAAFFSTSAPFDLHGQDLHVLLRPVLRSARHTGNLLYHVVAFHHLAKHSVLVVQPRCGCSGDEELAAIGVGPGVGHRKHAGLRMLQLGVKLVGEFVARPAAPGSLGTSSLNHEIGNDTM